MEEGIKDMALATSQILPKQEDDRDRESGDRFVKFVLSEEVNGVVLLEGLLGVIKVAIEDILPVPQVPEFFLGITNWQGEAIWIVDLANLVGGTHWCQREKVANTGIAMLVQVRDRTAGLLIEGVSAIEQYDRQAKLPISTLMLPERLRSFLQGYFLDSQNKPLMWFDLNAAIAVLQR